MVQHLAECFINLRRFSGSLQPSEIRMREVVKANADEAVRKKFAEMEADGSMDRIRELHAEDLAKAYRSQNKVEPSQRHG